MANNFRITGDIYVSKAGADSNAGTSPDAPKATISAGLAAITAINMRLVIGAGTYEEAISKTGTSFSGCTITADGNVVIRGDQTNGFVCSALAGASFNNLTIANYATYSTSGGIILNNCTLRDINFTANTNGTFNYCKFINVTINNNSQAANLPFVNFSIFINSAFKVSTLTNCYTNGFSQISIYSTATTVDYNNIMGTVKMIGGGGSTFQTLADAKTSFPTQNVHSFNLPPLFNDSPKEDFTLQISSPHIGAASDGTNIGGTNYARSFAALGAAEWSTANGAIFENVSLNGSDIVINSGSTSGRITSAPINFSSNPVIVSSINYFGLLLFNKSKAGGSDTNKNVPDANTYTGSDASGGGNPDRLSIEMRFVNRDTLPTAESDWLNGFLLPAGAFGKFMVNAQPYIDNNQRGNGEPNYNSSVLNPVVATWIQFRVTLRNDYL